MHQSQGYTQMRLVQFKNCANFRCYFKLEIELFLNVLLSKYVVENDPQRQQNNIRSMTEKDLVQWHPSTLFREDDDPINLNIFSYFHPFLETQSNSGRLLCSSS